MSETELIKDRAFAVSEIRKRLQIALLPNDERTPAGALDQLYTSAESVGNLIGFEEFEKQVKGMAVGESAPDFADTLKIIGKIDKVITAYADMLARNAEVGKVNVQAVDSIIYGKLTKLFASRNLGLLVIKSPSMWIL